MTEPNDLDGVVADIVVDAYGDDEQDTAFLTVFEEECELPTTATLLGTPVTVTGLDLAARGLVAICEGPQGAGEVSFADLAFPPDTLAAWIHAAYRHHLGLPPFPARPRPDWSWGA
jgi:hypothetical protein